MDDVHMMGDFEEVGEDLVDTDSFMRQRGAGEESYYGHEEDSQSTNDDSDAGLEWSQADLSALIDELELMDGYSDDEPRSEEDITWHRTPGRGRSASRSSRGESCERKKGPIGPMSHREDWYEYPYGHDFLQDFCCLQDADMELREELLNMLTVSDKGLGGSPVELQVQESLKTEIVNALNDILLPGLSRQGLKKLHRIIVQEPYINLRRHLENADPYLLAYIIWGLNFYMKRQAKDVPLKWRGIAQRSSFNLHETNPNKQVEDVRSEDSTPLKKSSIPEKICTLGSQFLTWLFNIIKGVNLGSTSYEEIIHQFSPLRVSYMMVRDAQNVRQ